MPSLEGEDSLLDGYYTTRRDAISKCGLAADRRGHRMFVVMPSRQCASGPTTEMYRKFLQSGHSKGWNAQEWLFGVAYTFSILAGMTIEVLTMLKVTEIHVFRLNK